MLSGRHRLDHLDGSAMVASTGLFAAAGAVRVVFGSALGLGAVDVLSFGATGLPIDPRLITQDSPGVAGEDVATIPNPAATVRRCPACSSCGVRAP
jgi:hypothetical protein